jgi:hypothetical protein
VAQAVGFGFEKFQAGPKAVSGQRSGPAWPGFFWLGLAWLLASGRSRHITRIQMAKKKSNQQPKQLNAANVGETEKASTTTAANHPTSIPPVDAHAPATTRLSFFNFLTIATTENVLAFLELAATTPEGANLERLWERAYEEGYEKGRKSLLRNLERKMEERFEEGVERGKDLGREEGYTVAKEAFDDIIKKVKARETPKVDTSEAEAQTDPPSIPTTSISTQTTFPTTSKARSFVENGVDARLAPTVAVSTQTNALIVTATPTTSMATQTELLNTISRATTDLFVQTDPISSQLSCQVIKPPSSSLSSVPVIPPVHTTTMGTQTDITTFQHLKISFPTSVAASQSPVPSKNAIKHEFSLNCSENPPKSTVFSSPTPSVTSLDSTKSFTTTTALKRRSTIAGFTQNGQIVENSNSSKQTSLPAFFEHTNDVTGVHTSQPTPNDVFPRPTTLSRVASSPEDSQAPAGTGHKKSALLRANFESQTPTELPVPTSIVTALKTHPEKAGFMGKHKKIDISPISNQNHLELPKSPVSGTTKPPASILEPSTGAAAVLASKIPSKTAEFSQKPPEMTDLHVLEHFDWADDANTLPISTTAPTKHPRDLSCLRSTSTHPFSSLRRKRGYPKNRWNTQCHSHHNYHPFPTWHRSSHLHTPFRVSNSLNWDQDPRLSDLSKALKALGWFRQ